MSTGGDDPPRQSDPHDSPTEPTGRPDVRAAGILLMRNDVSGPTSFLLMRHADRWDLPKGHCDGDESFRQTAIRETEEEIGWTIEQYELDPQFFFDIRYPVRRRKDGRTAIKHVRYYLAFTSSDADIRCTEHVGYQWMPWAPPHHIQSQTIDPLLAAVDRHLRNL